MKRIVLVFLLGIFICPFMAIAQEDGWKDLKWGMTFAEIKKIYKDENGKKCNNASLETYIQEIYVGIKELFYPGDLPKNELVELFCNDWYTGVFFFKGKFFGKVVKVDLSEKPAQEEIMKRLKEKYPKGKISYGTGVSSSKGKFRYPIFEYTSNTVKVFNNDYELYFYDLKTLNALLNSYTKNLQQIEEQKKQGLKKLF
ncbi:MAG: hypothetical protein C0415_01610 [Thermodesulfovibrio sp.]|nr:hypothetical protein [Thermodesulfovibrio sp.]